jgi:hypothetical protein
MVCCHRLLYHLLRGCIRHFFIPSLMLIQSVFQQFSGWSVFLSGNWVTADFITSYLPLVAFPILYVGARFWKRSRPVPASEMDFYTGIAEIEANTYDEPPPKNRVEAFWRWLVSDRVESFCMRPAHRLAHRCKRTLSTLHSFIQFFFVLILSHFSYILDPFV